MNSKISGAEYPIHKIFSSEFYYVIPSYQRPYAWRTEEAKRDEWLDKIANLVPLSQPKNSAAQNFDFERKKRVYFSGKSGTSAYALTTQVLGTSEWTEDVVANRQKELIDAFRRGWDL